jgi:hypothetical protein
MQLARFVHVFVAFSARSTAMLGMTGDQGAAMGNTHGGTTEKHDYLSYLLRLWWDGVEEGGWRASLEDPHSGERIGFGNLADLAAFLENETGSRSSGVVRPDEHCVQQAAKLEH